MRRNDQIGNLLIVLFLCIVVGYPIYRFAQQNNQIVRPNPDALPAPVISQLPELTAILRSAKERCESRAQVAIGLMRTGRISPKILTNGQTLYGDTRSEFNGCIQYLRTGLVTRFNNEDPEKIVVRMESAKEKMSRFINWSDNLESPVIGDFDPWAKFIDGLYDWLKEIMSQNDAAIERLRNDLTECRFRDWDELALTRADSEPSTGALPPSN